TARIEHWPLGQAFTISRGSKTEAIVVVAEVSDGVHTGRGECVPYPRYGETPEATLAQIMAMSNALRGAMDRAALQAAMPAGAARRVPSWLSMPTNPGQQTISNATLPRVPPTA